MPTEPSANSSFQFAHVVTAYAIALTVAHFWNSDVISPALAGTLTAVIVATLKEFIYDPLIERDGIGWWNTGSLNTVGGSLQDWTYWMVGCALAFTVLRWF